MRQQLLFLLMMAIASSLSNVVPVLSLKSVLYPHGAHTNHQQNDNTESRFTTRNIINNLFCNTAKSVDLPDLCKNLADKYHAFYDEIMDKDDNYNGEGYRKEQWHNYPRQLDRLQDYFSERHKPHDYNKRGMDNDDNNDEIKSAIPYHTDINTNDIFNGNDRAHTPMDSDKLLILQIPGNGDVTDKEIEKLLYELDTSQDGMNERLNEVSDLNPAITMLKFKRDNSVINREAAILDIQPETSQVENITVKKRLFSLWSRLQSLSHKGHKLHNRRYLHALYGMNEAGGGGGGGGGGALTAETRALMRPPGSPLRWG